MDNISNLRKQINLVDKEIVDLLIKRNDISRKIGIEKKNAGLPIYNPEREKEIFCGLQKYYPLNYNYLKAVFEEIIKQSRLIQN